MKRKPKNPKPTKPNGATIPAWECPRCGTTHPITVTKCCGPSEWHTPHTPPYMPPTMPWDQPPHVICGALVNTTAPKAN